MLISNSISFSYDNSYEFHFPDIRISKGESLLILGESGVGKTTFLQILAGLLKPKSGSLELNGTKYENLSSAALDNFRGKHIGMVFQKSHFARSISLLDNLMLALFLAGQKQNKAYAKELIESMGLGDKLKANPYSLSHGEQQRVSIALAVIKRPSLILADEPTSSLDDKNCEKIVKLLREQAASSEAKLVIITHDQRLKDQFSKSILL
ncbi:MAG: ATP-binding cassette domain-containing protein [Flavobacteriales bacterium]|nr:ATP-binding cassette domain-containing protein [Flavobacteriales bacterium]